MPTPHWQLLDKYLANDATDDESAMVREWIDASASNRAFVDFLRSQARSAGDVDVDAAWRRVAARTVAAAAAATRFPWRRAAVWAAAAVIVVVVGARVARLGRDETRTRLAALEWRVVAPAAGQRATVTLPDSSTVVVNGGSRLRFAKWASTATRDVELDGEAYFTVRHDATRPFQVFAAGTRIQDVGTRFVVRAYDSTRATIVVVTEGAVGIHSRGGYSTMAAAGTLATISPSGSIATSRADTTRYTAFAHGRLVIDDLALADAAPVIERWFGVSIRVTDTTLERRRLSADFAQSSLSSVLDAVAVALDVDIRRQRDTIVISPRSKAP